MENSRYRWVIVTAGGLLGCLLKVAPWFLAHRRLTISSELAEIPPGLVDLGLGHPVGLLAR